MKQALLAIMLLIFFITSAQAATTVTLMPTQPSVMNPLTITIATDTDTERAQFIYSECVSGSLCSLTKTVELIKTGPGLFEGAITLDWDEDASYLQYTIKTLTQNDDTWQESYKDTRVDYIPAPVSPKPVKTPAFELFTILTALLASIILIKRRKINENNN